MSLKDVLRRFIVEELMEDEPTADLRDDEPLIERGIIDSMGAMQIIGLIEEETGLRIPDREVVLENFENVSAMDAMVQRLSQKGKGYAESGP